MKFAEHIGEYKKQLKKGDIQIAYKGLMKYLLSLRAYFKTKYPEYAVSANFYYGYMDMTFFSLNPKLLKNKNLKIIVLFSHDKFRFEILLAARNRKIQAKYWNLFKENTFDKHHVPESIAETDAIVKFIVVDDPDFSDLDILTKDIEQGVSKFIEDIEGFVSSLS